MKKSEINLSKVIISLVLSIILIFGGAMAGKKVHTSDGEVKIQDIQYVTEDGALLRALLYIPKSATEEFPAPAVVSSHGYNNTAEVQDLNCVELSRRGYVVIAIDAYGHGISELPDTEVGEGIVKDMGTYSAMQYLGKLPYVDTNRIGMVGHSMGAGAIQDGADRAYKNLEKNPNIVVPKAVLPTANSFTLTEEGKPILEDYNVNIGAVYGQFDEWAFGMWGVDKGSDANKTEKTKATFGFENPEYNEYYEYGKNEILTKEGAVKAAEEGKLRVLFQPPHTHPVIHFNGESVGDVVDFFAITLNEGVAPFDASDQVWFGKQVGTGISMVGFFIFIVSLGLLLLKSKFFGTIIKPEPDGLTTVNSTASRIRYWVIFIIGLLPAPLLYNYLVGYPIDITAQGRTVPILMPASKIFPLPAVNGIFLLNIITGLIALALYLLIFFTVAKKAGCTKENMGISLSGKEIFKSALLAIIVFIAGYMTLVLCDYFFKTDFRFFTISMRPLTSVKWGIYLRYLPSFLLFFLISSMSQNTFTRMNNKKEWINIILITISSFGGLLILHLLDYISLKHTGIKMFVNVPGSEGVTAALAGVLLWGLLVILPIAAIISRIFFKKTGSIWVGGFINSLIVTLYAISNTVIAAQIF